MDTRAGAWDSHMVIPTVPITVTVMVTVVTMIPGVPGDTEDTMEDIILTTEDHTGPDTTMAGTMDTTTDQEGVIILRLTTVMAIWTAGIPADMPIDPKRLPEVQRDPLQVMQGTEAEALQLPRLQLQNAAVQDILIVPLSNS